MFNIIESNYIKCVKAITAAAYKILDMNTFKRLEKLNKKIKYF